MSAKSQWYSLSVKWSESDWLEALPWPVRSIWPEFLAKVKQNGKNGRLPSTSLKRFAGSSDIPLEYVEQFFEAAFAEGAVTIDELDRWTVTNWDEYQIDSVEARKRKQEQRARDKTQKESESREIEEKPKMSRDNLENHDMSRDIDQKTGDVTESPVTRDHQTTRPPDKEKEPTNVGSKKALDLPEDQPEIFDLAVPESPPWWIGWEPENLVERHVILLAHWAASVTWKDGPRAFPNAVIDREKITEVARILAELDPMPQILENELKGLQEYALKKLAKTRHWTHPERVLMTNIVNRHESKWRAAKSQRNRENQGTASVYARAFGRDGSQREANPSSFIEGEVASAS